MANLTGGHVPLHLRFAVTPQNPVLDPGQPLQLGALLQDTVEQPLTLIGSPPSLEVYDLSATEHRPIWSYPLDAWKGATLRPGQELTASVEWPGTTPGVYQLDFGEFQYSLPCERMWPRVSGGGTLIHVRMPAGQAINETLEPGRSTTVDAITVRVDQIRFDAEATHVQLWVSDLQAPAGLLVSLLRDGSEALGRTGLSNRDAPGGGVDVQADFGPVPQGTSTVTVEVSDIDRLQPGVGVIVDHGPWRLVVPVTAAAASSPGS